MLSNHIFAKTLDCHGEYASQWQDC